MILGKEIEIGKFYRYDHDKTYFVLVVCFKQIADVDFALVLSKTKVNKHVFKFVYLDHEGRTYSEQIDQRTEIGDIF